MEKFGSGVYIIEAVNAPSAGDPPRRATKLGKLDMFGLQALLASFHAAAATFEDTIWKQIVRTYGLAVTPKPLTVTGWRSAVTHRKPNGCSSSVDLGNS